MICSAPARLRWTLGAFGSRQSGPADAASGRSSGEGSERRGSPARCASSANGSPVVAVDRLGQPAGPSLSARTIARGLTVERDTASSRIALVNATIETAAPELVAARDLLDCFHAMMRSSDAARLNGWITSRRQARKLRRVRRGGQGRHSRSNRRALVQRSGRRQDQPAQAHQQMFGRANLDLLKARLMAAA